SPPGRPAPAGRGIRSTTLNGRAPSRSTGGYRARLGRPTVRLVAGAFPLLPARKIDLRLTPDTRPVPDAPALHPDRSDERPTVLVAVSEPFVAAGIRFVLEQDGFDVSAGVSSAEEAVAFALATEPRVCLLDQELDGDVV